MSAKDRALELYQEHIALASTDGRLFRKTVMEQLMAETGCSLAAAATHYNTAKKANPAIEGLGRAPAPKGLVKSGGKEGTKPKKEQIQDDDECFSVLELVKCGNEYTVGRCQSFLMQGDASEKFDQKSTAWPSCNWVLIKGLGPNAGESYRLDSGEKEIKRKLAK